MAIDDYAKKKKATEKSMSANKEKFNKLKSTCDKAKIRIETLSAMFDENIKAVNNTQTDVNWVKSNLVPQMDKIIELQTQLKDAEKEKDAEKAKSLKENIETLHKSLEPLKERWKSEIIKENEMQSIMQPNLAQLKKLGK